MSRPLNAVGVLRDLDDTLRPRLDEINAAIARLYAAASTNGQQNPAGGGHPAPAGEEAQNEQQERAPPAAGP